MSESLDLCTKCITGHLRPTGEVLAEGESVGEFRDIGGRRIFICDICKHRQVRIGVHEYIAVGDDIRTEPDKRQT